MLSIQFNSAAMTLFGGRVLSLTGALAMHHSISYLLMGNSGSGKSTLLSAISLLAGVNVPPVDSLDRSKIFFSGLGAHGRVGFVYQNPIDNFYGGPLFDAIRVSVAASDLDPSIIATQLGDMLASIFEINPNFLNKDPMHLSSGQQQLVAAALQLIMRPDILLMDEPFARLSHANAQRLIRLIKERCQTTYCLIATHVLTPGDSDGSAGVPPTQSYEISRIDDDVSIALSSRGHTKSPMQLTRVEFLQGVSSLMGRFVDRGAMELGWTETGGFINLPDKGPKCISGAGDNIFGKLSAFVVTEGERYLCHGDITVCGGLNILYADNGAGKTLVCRILAGELSPSSWITKRLHSDKVLFSAKAAFLQMGGRKDSFSRLAARSASFFMPVDPGLRVGGLTVEKTIEIFDKGSKDKALKLLDGYGVGPNARVDDLPFGLQKVLSFFFMPERLSLAILDEPFANLPDCLQSAIAEEILYRIQNNYWASVVVTANRPCETLMLFGNVASTVS